MALGHVNVVLKCMYLYVLSGLRNWNGYYYKGSVFLCFLGFKDPGQVSQSNLKILMFMEKKEKPEVGDEDEEGVNPEQVCPYLFGIIF